MKYVSTMVVAVVFLGCFIGGLAFERFVLGKHKAESGSEISMQIQSKQMVTPGSYNAHLLFSSTNALLKTEKLTPEQEQEIKESFKQINDLVKDSHLCQQTSYSLKPNYTFKQELSGYSLHALMICNIPTPKLSDYETLKNKISEVVAKSALFVLNTPALYAKMQESDIVALQGALLKEAQDKASFFSQKFKRQCAIKSLDFYPNHFPMRFKVEGQQDSKQTFNLTARLTVGC
ncbi:hypothetical protein [Helicobacter suis]|uniref:hypothetical protein n=1 Tax=Helicobacter suis TaxID=104628 RepID=UPI0013D8BBDC|nr:hypothetical protein [Helicobacter suis]